jgi:hypothetical protein
MESILYVNNYSCGDDVNSGATTEMFSLYSNSKYEECVNTFAAIVDLSRFNNSCLRLLKISDDNNE